MDQQLPVYKITINPELAEDGERLGIEQIAYTADPAILKKGVYLDAAAKLRFADSLKYRVAAPALIPMQIYRFSDHLGEYMVEFTEQEIETLVADFMANKNRNIFNLDHDQALQAPAYILESWIVEDPATDKSFTQYGIQGLPKGSWFVVSQFTDKEYFKTEIIEKERTGYSIEGFLGMQLNKIKQNKMEETKPAAETVENTKVEVAETAKTELAAPMEQAPAQPEAPAEQATEPKIDEAQILAVLQPKLDELYAQIADLKQMVETSALPKPAEKAPEKMSAATEQLMGFSSVMKFISKK